jgi:hypothetical protein
MSPVSQRQIYNATSSQTTQCNRDGFISLQPHDDDFISFQAIFDAYDDRAREIGRYHVKLDRLSKLCGSAPNNIEPEWFLSEITRERDRINDQNHQLEFILVLCGSNPKTIGPEWGSQNHQLHVATVPCGSPFLGSYKQLGEKLAELDFYYERMEAWKEKNIRKSVDCGLNVVQQLIRYNEVCLQNDVLWEQFFIYSWRSPGY